LLNRINSRIFNKEFLSILMKNEEIYQTLSLISILITFVGIALFILSIIDSWNLAFLIPGSIMFVVGMKFGIAYAYRAKNGKGILESKLMVKIFKKLKVKKILEIRLKILERCYERKKKRLKKSIKTLK
jgi:hypothetical protein